MRSTVRRLVVALCIMPAILLSAGTASASDNGLRTLVSEQRAAEKRLDHPIDADSLYRQIRSSRPPATAGRRGARFMRKTAMIFTQLRESYDSYLPRFTAEAAETNEANAGRTLMVRGLRDGTTSFRRSERFLLRAANGFARARTQDDIEDVLRRLASDDRRRDMTGERSQKRLKRGRTLIRMAPAPANPAS